MTLSCKVVKPEAMYAMGLISSAEMVESLYESGRSISLSKRWRKLIVLAVATLLTAVLVGATEHRSTNHTSGMLTRKTSSASAL